MRYLVAGKYKFHTYKDALAKCESIHHPQRFPIARLR